MSRLENILSSLPYTPSKYQRAIAEWVVDGQGHAMVNAVAGSGKTATLTDIVAKLLDGQALFCAFNKHIATELGSKLRGTPVSSRTLHSAGMAAVRDRFKSVKVESGKYRVIIGKLVDELFDTRTINGRPLSPEAAEGMEAEGAAASPRVLSSKLVDLCRSTLTEPDEQGLREVADHFGLPVEPHQWVLVRTLVVAALERGVMDAPRVIDYTDMVWLPTKLNLTPYQYDWVLVDECQDLNAAQLELALKLVKRTGRLLFVGDPYQAIYGFAGADCDSFWNIQKRTEAKVLPLSICYRCPSEHVWLAQEIVPGIESAPGAIEGGVHDIDFGEMVEMLEEDDVVLCRNTAPLIPACYALLREGKPAYVAGRAIGEGIAKAVEEACKLYSKAHKTAATMSTLGDAVDLWEAKETAGLKRRNIDEDSQQWSDLNDRVSCVTIFWSRSEASSIDGFLSEIRSLFSDNQDNATRLSTVHRAKGLEANRVFLLKPELMPSPHARMSWERQQEENLRYVALTRAKEALHFVDGPV